MRCPGGQQADGKQRHHDCFEVDSAEELQDDNRAAGSGEGQWPSLGIRGPCDAPENHDDTGERECPQDQDRSHHGPAGQRIGALEQGERQGPIGCPGHPPDRVAREQAGLVTQNNRTIPIRVEIGGEHGAVRHIAVDVQTQDRWTHSDRQTPDGDDDRGLTERDRSPSGQQAQLQPADDEERDADEHEGGQG